jgi:hypothetical protein
MRPNTSPLEHLAAFAIVFTTAILSAVSLAADIDRVRKNAVRDNYKRTSPALPIRTEKDSTK